MWITHRDDPGGVPRFIETQVTVWYETLASSAVISCVFMGDALLVCWLDSLVVSSEWLMMAQLYRAFHVYSSSFAVLAVPLVAYITALGKSLSTRCYSSKPCQNVPVVLAIMQVVVSGEPNGNFFGLKTIKIAVSYYAITICLNITLTILICIRLVRMSKRITEVLGEELARTYTSAAAILIESAAFYSASGIMYLIPYALQFQVGIFFGQIWTKMSVSFLYIIFINILTTRDVNSIVI